LSISQKALGTFPEDGRITIEVEKEFIAKHGNGVRASNLVTLFVMETTTICTLFKNKETI
jgi:hypothetical protein